MTTGALRVVSQGAVEASDAPTAGPSPTAVPSADAPPCGSLVMILKQPAGTVATRTNVCAPQASGEAAPNSDSLVFESR